MTKLDQAREAYRLADLNEWDVARRYDLGEATISELKRAVNHTMDALAVLAELED